jgi:dTDP-4-amino-4,6-dideoxygalactose transaminase
MYTAAFQGYDFIQPPPDGAGNAWHLYLLRIVPEKLKIGRDDFSAILRERGIGTSMHFIPHFRLTYWRNRYSLRPEDFPHAEKQFQTTISLPLWPGMTEEMARRVIDAVTEIGKEHYGSP